MEATNYSHAAWALDGTSEEKEHIRAKPLANQSPVQGRKHSRWGFQELDPSQTAAEGLQQPHCLDQTLQYPQEAAGPLRCTPQGFQLLSQIFGGHTYLRSPKDLGKKIAFCIPLAAFRITNTEPESAAGNRALPPKASLGAAKEDFGLWGAPARNQQ